MWRKQRRRSAVQLLLICVFVFEYADCWFSNAVAQFSFVIYFCAIPEEQNIAKINCCVSVGQNNISFMIYPIFNFHRKVQIITCVCLILSDVPIIC